MLHTTGNCCVSPSAAPVRMAHVGPVRCPAATSWGTVWGAEGPTTTTTATTNIWCASAATCRRLCRWRPAAAQLCPRRLTAAASAAQRLQAAKPAAAGTNAGQQGSSNGGDTAREGWWESRGDARLLTQQLTAATSPEQLLQLLQQNEVCLDHIHISAAYTRAGKVCGRGAGAAAQQQASAAAAVAAAAAVGVAEQQASTIAAAEASAGGGEAVQQQLLSVLHKLAERLQQQCSAWGLANIIWSCSKLSSPATAQLLLPQFLQASRLQQATPQGVWLVLRAAATLKLQLGAAEVQQLLDRLVAVLPGAKPQDVSNTLWAVATMGQQVPPQQLQQLLDRLVAVLPDAKPWHQRMAYVVSDSLWAVATMQRQVSAQHLQQLLAAFGNCKQLAAAQPGHTAKLLWACAKLHYLPLQLLQSLQEHPNQLQLLLAAAKPHELVNMVWACGELGYAGELPEALLQRASLLQGGVTCGFTVPQLCSLCWSAAVLDLLQCVPQVLQLASAASQLLNTASSDPHICRILWWLHQVHLWLLDSQLPAPNQGLSCVLTQQQLEQCRASYDRMTLSTAHTQPFDRQKLVFDAVLQLPPGTWQPAGQPQSRQLTDDRAHLLDISAVTASRVQVAVEVVAPYDYVQPSNTLRGPTLFRHRALAARGYAVVRVPYWDWDALHSTEEQQKYLLTKLSNLQVRVDASVSSGVNEHCVFSCWGQLDSPSCWGHLDPA